MRIDLIHTLRLPNRDRQWLTLLATSCVLWACADQSALVVQEPYVGDAPFPNLRPQFVLPEAGLGAVSNNGSDSVTLLDLNSQMVIGSASVGLDPVANDGPHHIALDRAQGAAYIALAYPAPTTAPGPHAAHGGSQRPGYVQKLALEDLRPLGEVQIETNPGDIVLSEDGSRLVVSHFDLLRAERETELLKQRADLAVLNPAELEAGGATPIFIKTCIAPHGVALSRPSGDTAFVACYGEDALAVVDLTRPDSQPKLVSLGPGGGPADPIFGPYAAVLSPDATTVAVSSTQSKDVRFFDVASGAFTSSVIRTPGAPYFAAWTADSRTVLVPTQSPDALVVADVSTGKIQTVRTFHEDECQLPHEAVWGDESSVYLVCEGDHQNPSVVLVLDASTLDVVTSLPVGVYPDRLALDRGQPP